MDTKKDADDLNKMWVEDKALWKVWSLETQQAPAKEGEVSMFDNIYQGKRACSSPGIRGSKDHGLSEWLLALRRRSQADLRCLPLMLTVISELFGLE